MFFHFPFIEQVSWDWEFEFQRTAGFCGVESVLLEGGALKVIQGQLENTRMWHYGRNYLKRNSGFDHLMMAM